MIHARTISRLGFAALACAPLSVALGEGSELPDGSVMITSLPFVATGDTSDNVDDYDAVCPWASDAPDVFYGVQVDGPTDYCHGPAIRFLNLTLCESSYDTKVFVLDDAFNEIACNDDFCTSAGGGGFRSSLQCVQVEANRTYFIAIDGWSGDAGVYELLIDESPCLPGAVCIFSEEDCPAGSLSEDEPCHDGTTPDTTNGGCDSDTQLFRDVSCGDTICGRIAATSTSSDFDFFELATSRSTLVQLSFGSEFEARIGRVTEGSCAAGQPECACIDGTLDPTCLVGPCYQTTLIDEASAGRSWWVVTAAHLGALPCGGEVPGNDYVASFSCDALPCCSSGDATQDGAVTFDDLIVMLSNWGECAAPPCCELGDANGDGTIGFDDVVLALANWGPCGG